MRSTIDRVLEDAVARGVAPGIVALAADAGGVCYEGAFGRAGPGDAPPLGLEAVFRIQSMTKAVTAAAAMQLVEQGRLALDQPMNGVAPELGAARVLLGFDADGSPRTRPPRRDITLRHLLTHTSGFAYDMFSRDVARYLEHEGLPRLRSGRLAALRAPLRFDPGERWEYGIGLDWVGRIVECVTATTLEAYFQENLLRPLGMNDTSFVFRGEWADRLAALAARGPDGRLGGVDLRPAADAEFHSGGGGLYSTGPDYLRFTRMLLGGGALDGVRVLAPETVALMGSNAIGTIEVPDFTSDNPSMALTHREFPGQIQRWGLSFLLNTEDLEGGRGAGSMSWGGVFNTKFWIDPKRGLSTVLMMQTRPFADPPVLELQRRYEQALYAGRR
jgi:methyl acetate hydrolase